MELRRVTGPRSPFEGNAGRVIALVSVAILVAILKPWGGPSGTVSASPRPSLALATPSPSTTPPRIFDYHAFGPIEPKARWEIWPAGQLISFSFAMRVEGDPPPSTAPGGAPASPTPPAPMPTPTRPAGSAAPSATPEPGSYVWPGTTGPSAAAWPTEIRIPGASVLYVLGLSRPVDYAIEVMRMTRFDPDGSSHAVRVILGPSPWPDHFTIVGVGAEDGSGAMEPWPPGHYVLDVRIDPGSVGRSIDIFVDPVTDPAEPSIAP
ncbi:MAG: hypothetical protein ABI562_05320 [Chloroflexota bacterium]